MSIDDNFGNAGFRNYKLLKITIMPIMTLTSFLKYIIAFIICLFFLLCIANAAENEPAADKPQETAVKTDTGKPDSESTAEIEKTNNEKADESVVLSPRAKLVRRYEGSKSPVNSIAFSADGKQLLAASGGPEGDNSAYLWNVEDGKLLQTFKGHTDRVNHAAFIPNSNRIITASDDKTLRVWNVDDGKDVFKLAEHLDQVKCVAVHPSGKIAVSGSKDCTFTRWDLETGKATGMKRAHKSTVMSIAYSKDGKFILTGSRDMTLRLWDADSAKWLQEYGGKSTDDGHRGSILSAAISPDNKMLLSGSMDNTVRLWETKTGNQLLCTWSTIKQPVYTVAFSPDGRKILAGSGDFQARVWDIKTGEEELRLRGDGMQSVLGAAFSPDGKTIATSSRDKIIRLWSP